MAMVSDELRDLIDHALRCEGVRSVRIDTGDHVFTFEHAPTYRLKVPAWMGPPTEPPAEESPEQPPAVPDAMDLAMSLAAHRTHESEE